MRVKLYKSGKIWVAAAAAIVTITAVPTLVSADTTTPDSTTVTNDTATRTDSTTANSDKATKTDSTTASSDTATKTDSTTANSDKATKTDGTTVSSDTATKTDSTIANSDTASSTSIAPLNSDSSTDLNSKTTVITKNNDGTSTTNITYANLKDVADNIASLNSDTSVPYFNADAIKNLPAMTTANAQTGEIQDLDVWDSWALQDAATGAVTNYHGYNIAFALAGSPKDDGDQHIYMLYTKYGDTALNNWKNAGPVCGLSATNKKQQWSGSATVNDDDG